MGKSKKYILNFILSLILSLYYSVPAFSQPEVIDLSNKKEILDDKVQNNPVSQSVLSMLETKLDSNTTQIGEEFSAKLMEDVISGNQIVIPKLSLVSGTVIKVNKAGKLNKNASIKLNITKIKTPDEKVISLEDKPMPVDITPPAHKPEKEGLLVKAPGTVASSATSFVLGNYSPTAKVIVWTASTGAGILAGMISGFIAPEPGKTRMQSSTERALNSTSLGSVVSAVKKGEDFSLDTGQALSIYFDKDYIKHIQESVSSIPAIQVIN